MFCSLDDLRNRRLARVVCAVAAVVVSAHGETAQAGGEKVEWVRSVVVAAIHAAAVGEAGCVVVAGVGEGGLGTAVEASGLHTTAVTVASVHWRIRRSSSAHARRHTIAGWRSAKGLAGEATCGTESTSTTTVSSGTRSTGHRRRAHLVGRRSAIHAHAGRELANDGGLGTAGTAAETVDVLGKVVVVATLDATAPITSTERDGVVAAAAHTVAMAAVTTHVSAWHTHHVRVSVTITAVHWRLLVLVGRVRAPEACSAALEVAEATGWAGPVARARAVLAWGESSEDVRSAVKNTGGGWGDLDGLFVQSTSVHTQRFCSLDYVSLCFLVIQALLGVGSRRPLLGDLALCCIEDSVETYLFVGGKDGKAGASRLVLVRSPEGPEGDWPATKLREPALQFRLSGVVREAAHVQDLAALSEESPNIGTSVHWASEHIRVLVSRLRLADETTEDSSKRNGLFHGTTGRCWRKSLEVEGQVVLDRRRGLNWLDLQSSADVGQGAGAERQRLGVVCLPSLVFGAKIKSPRVL